MTDAFVQRRQTCFINEKLGMTEMIGKLMGIRKGLELSPIPHTYTGTVTNIKRSVVESISSLVTRKI